MRQTSPFRFSLAKLFAFILVIGVTLGSIRGLFLMKLEENYETLLQGQERVVNEMGGRIIGYAKKSRLPVSIDLTDTSVDCPWISERLPEWPYSEVDTIIVPAAVAEQPEFSDLMKRFPKVHFVVAAAHENQR